MSAIVTVSFTISGGTSDDMHDATSKIITAAVKIAKRAGLRVSFMREEEEDAK